MLTLACGRDYNRWYCLARRIFTIVGHGEQLLHDSLRIIAELGGTHLTAARAS